MDIISRVNALEAELTKLPQRECPVWHHFAPGVYARQMFIRAGTVATGAVHKTEHLCIVSGDIDVVTDEGVQHIRDLQYVFVSKAGTKRAVFTREDTLLTTVHVTDETDLDRLAEELCDATTQQLLGGSENLQAIHNRLKDQS